MHFDRATEIEKLSLVTARRNVSINRRPPPKVDRQGKSYRSKIRRVYGQLVAKRAAMSKKTDEREWTSLEIAKLVVGIMTPLAILYFTTSTDRARDKETAARTAAAQMETDREARYLQVTKKRVDLWEQISPRLNDIYCYFLYVGQWKKLSPTDVVNAKREADRYFYSNLPFFTLEFIHEYQQFMKETFKTGTGWKKDALLRTVPIRDLDTKMDAQFTNEDNTTPIFDSYFRLLKVGGELMDVNISPVSPKPETPNAAEIQTVLSRKQALGAKQGD